MSTGLTYKRLKRRFKKKLYNFLLYLNDLDFSRLRPFFYLLLIAGVLLAWAKLPTTETTGTASGLTTTASDLAASIRTSLQTQNRQPVDIVALFLPQNTSETQLSDSLAQETLYRFYLTGKELTYLAEGAVTISKNNTLYLDGLSFTYHKNRLPFNRITELTMGSGAEVADNHLYQIVSTEDIFALFHYVSYRTLGIMSIYPKDASGSLLSDYQKVILTETGTPFTVQTALTYTKNTSIASAATLSVVTMRQGFNLIDLIKEPNRITICVCALFIAFFALLWYIVPRMRRIRIWLRIYRIRRKKRSAHHPIYELKKRF